MWLCFTINATYIYIYITDLIIDTFIHSNKNVVSNWLLKRGGMEESVFGTAGKVCSQDKKFLLKNKYQET